MNDSNEQVGCGIDSFESASYEGTYHTAIKSWREEVLEKSRLTYQRAHHPRDGSGERPPRSPATLRFRDAAEMRCILGNDPILNRIMGKAGKI